MITVIKEKPVYSIDVKGYGVDSYVDKNGKKVYRVFGIVEAGSRGRLVSRDSDVIKDLYIDDTTIVIFRSENKKDCIACKDMIDGHVARGIPVFVVEQFKQWLENPQVSIEDNVKEEGEPNVN